MNVILAVLTGGSADRSVLDHAEAAARGAAHIDVRHARRDPRDSIPVLGEGMSPDLVQRIMDEAARECDRRAASARRAFEDWTRRSGIAVAEGPGAAGMMSTRWLETVGRIEDIGPTAGRLADLIVVARPAETGSEDQAVVEAALFGSGRPVLLVPNGAPLPSGIAAIFWNGSAEAARTVGYALPMLRACETVHVLQLEDGPSAGTDLTGYLAWHGIASEVSVLQEDYREPGAALLEEAAKFGAGLVVMGAYTHSRMRQMILGGVTSHVLTACAVPILLAH